MVQSIAESRYEVERLAVDRECSLTWIANLCKAPSVVRSDEG